MTRFLFLLLSLFISPAAQALDAITLSFEHIKMQNWQLQNVSIGLTRIEKKSSQLQLGIQKLFLPKPFEDLKLLQVQCSRFKWNNNEIHCLQGKAQLQSKLFNAPRCDFSFHITPKQSQFQIQQFKLLDGSFDLQGLVQTNNWQLSLNGKQIGLAVLHQLLFPQLKLTSGTVNLNGKAQGNRQSLKKFNLQIQTDNLFIQTADGTKATEALNLILNLNAAKVQQKLWLWESDNVFQQGNLYIDPLYLENKGSAMSLQGHGYWDEAKQTIELNQVKFNHPKIGFITAHGFINHHPRFSIENANVYMNFADLEAASAIYLTPFVSATALEGVSLSGQLESGIAIKKQEITDAYLHSNKFAIMDKKQRFNLEKGITALNWSNQTDFNQNSMFSWQKFNLFNIPLEQSYVSFLLKDKKISLLRETTVPVLEGQIQIKQFDWQAVKNKSPNLHFSGQIQQVSLEKLTKALNWQPLPGKLSGQIPKVNFAEGKLTLDGGLKINVFDGEININKLALSGLMSDFSQFYSDIEINHLDLQQLTQQFSFGGMQGRVSGYINDLYLENWQPIGFYAWLGTPDDDDSTHQISQKAVENIANIGGGGVVDLLSRTVLKAFDNFGYDQLGLGCYLHNGVCQLMGVAAADYGYYIVKGGGLPRIDVMGYNPRIDWSVLQERLQRITKSSSNAVIN